LVRLASLGDQFILNFGQKISWRFCSGKRKFFHFTYVIKR